jgi:hypothetical protein
MLGTRGVNVGLQSGKQLVLIAERTNRVIGEANVDRMQLISIYGRPFFRLFTRVS